MYGILWTKADKAPVLTMAGNAYDALYRYLEDAFLHCRYYHEGYMADIVPVRKDGEKWAESRT